MHIMLFNTVLFIALGLVMVLVANSIADRRLKKKHPELIGNTNSTRSTGTRTGTNTRNANSSIHCYIFAVLPHMLQLSANLTT